MCCSPEHAGHAGRRWWGGVRSAYLPLPAPPGACSPGADSSRTSVLGQGLQVCQGLWWSCYVKAWRHFQGLTDLLQKGTLLPFGHEKALVWKKQNKTGFKCKTKPFLSCFTNFRAIYSWNSFRVFKMNMGNDAEKRPLSTVNIFVGIALDYLFVVQYNPEYCEYLQSTYIFYLMRAIGHHSWKE